MRPRLAWHFGAGLFFLQRATAEAQLWHDDHRWIQEPAELLESEELLEESPEDAAKRQQVRQQIEHMLESMKEPTQMQSVPNVVAESLPFNHADSAHTAQQSTQASVIADSTDTPAESLPFHHAESTGILRSTQTQSVASIIANPPPTAQRSTQTQSVPIHHADSAHTAQRSTQTQSVPIHHADSAHTAQRSTQTQSVPIHHADSAHTAQRSTQTQSVFNVIADSPHTAQRSTQAVHSPQQAVKRSKKQVRASLLGGEMMRRQTVSASAKIATASKASRGNGVGSNEKDDLDSKPKLILTSMKRTHQSHLTSNDGNKRNSEKKAKQPALELRDAQDFSIFTRSSHEALRRTPLSSPDPNSPDIPLIINGNMRSLPQPTTFYRTFPQSAESHVHDRRGEVPKPGVAGEPHRGHHYVVQKEVVNDTVTSDLSESAANQDKDGLRLGGMTHAASATEEHSQELVAMAALQAVHKAVLRNVAEASEGAYSYANQAWNGLRSIHLPKPNVEEMKSSMRTDSDEGEREEEPRLPKDVSKAGLVHVKDAFVQEGERLQAEERNAACLDEQNRPITECMEKYGSYGIRRLYTESFHSVVQMGWERADWMADTEVRNQHLFKLTLPMTHLSGSYKVENGQPTARLQKLRISQQLRLGVRALDLPVVVSAEGIVHTASDKSLTERLDTVMLDVKRFLETHENEVVFLFLRKHTDADGQLIQGNASEWSHDLLLKQDHKEDVVPGQLVHLEVEKSLTHLLALYPQMAQLKDPADPTISDLVRNSARVIYFWQGQQVLCTTHETCKDTPGWMKSNDLAFGLPQKNQKRMRLVSGPVVEPICFAPSGASTRSQRSLTLARRIEAYSVDPVKRAAAKPPLCHSNGDPMPALGKPNVLHGSDAFVTLSQQTKDDLASKMNTNGELYVHGEPLTSRTVAERVNLLLLRLFFHERNGIKDGYQPYFRQPQLVAMDFIAPIHVHRIIEAVQNKRECGYSLFCAKTGSCFAMSKLGPDDQCLTEEVAYQRLAEHAMQDEPYWLRCLRIFTYLMVLKVIVLLLAWTYCPWHLLPKISKTDEGFRILFMRREPGSTKAEPAGSAHKNTDETKTSDLKGQSSFSPAPALRGS